MKRILFLLLMFSAVSYGQTFGSYGIEVSGPFNSNKPVYNKWLQLSNKTDVVMKFEMTEKGLSDLLAFSSQILLQNEEDSNEPDIYLTKINDGSRDNLDGLYKSIIRGRSKINEAWNLPEGSTLHLFASNTSFEITILKAYKS